MILQIKSRAVVALTCMFVSTGAVFLWMPQFIPFSKYTENWLEQRSNNYNELQNLHRLVLDAEFSYKTYIVTGDEEWHKKFKSVAAKISNKMSLLRSLNDDETRILDKLRAIQNKLNDVLEELKREANLRSGQDSDRAKELLSTTKQVVALKDISSDIVIMERSEYDLLRENVLMYDNIVKSGPYPWVALLLIFGISSLVAFSGARLPDEENISQDSDGTDVKQLKSDLAEAKSQLERLSNLDGLTEVLNMQGLEKILSVEENRMVRAGGHLIAVLINCDNFSKVNEELGHTGGDKVLKDVAKRIVGTLRPSDHVARLEGDEFVVLLPDTQLAYGMRVADRIRVTVNDTPLHNAKTLEKVTVSVGVATIPQTVSSVEEVVSHARSALKRSKDGGKDKVSLAREVSNIESTEEQKTLVSKLTDTSSYRVVFQPILDLGSDEVAGFEIFTRGLEGSFESPDEFFKLCIENNILTQVDLQCIKLCVEKSKSIADEMRVHLNVFPSTIVDTSIEEFLALFPPSDSGHKFCIELSEQHFIIEPKHMRDSINAIREAGVMVAIDDIGFGRSSLESLILLEPDVVKVDRKYVTGVSDDVGKVRLLKRLTNVAKSLGAEVVAEGIERKDDIPILQDLGVHFGQGFVWGDLMEVLPEDFDEQRTLFRSS